MAYIESGAGAAEKLTIDATSKAARVTLYDSTGTELVTAPTGSYMAPLVRARFTGALAAAKPCWALRNGATKTLYVRRLSVICGFDGTAAATSSQFELIRFDTATHSTGTAITPAKKRTSYDASTVADVRYRADGTTLTETSVVYDTAGPLLEFGCPRGATASVATFDFVFNNALEGFDCIEVPANAGLAIRTVAAVVIGDTVLGCIEWDER